jgi:hypothetical protein
MRVPMRSTGKCPWSTRLKDFRDAKRAVLHKKYLLKIGINVDNAYWLLKVDFKSQDDPFSIAELLLCVVG